MKENFENNTKQLLSGPKSFELHKFFGPYFAEFMLPSDVIEALLKMTDTLLGDSKKIKFSKNLAGVIDEEVMIFKEDLLKFGVSDILERCVRSYVMNTTKLHSIHQDDYEYQSIINSAWIVSQYENEYNPVHSHTNADISAVLYLKTPNVKGRRNIKGKSGDNDSDITFIYNAASTRDRDIFDRGIINFSPGVGQLLMFPSYLFHTVYPFLGTEERRSIAFNAVYTISKNKEILYGSPEKLNFHYKFHQTRKEHTK
jgi:uncharacterized protein (TIGR02466 family)|tara:strand:- start:1718 stop:2485 length:768 start_codon:yes stop_codon:yes gene_type:complete